MSNPIVAGLTRLAQFEGRDSSGRFWPYASLVLALAFVVMCAPFVIELNKTFQAINSFAAEHPELTTVHRGPGQVSIQIEGSHPELTPDFAYLVNTIGLVAAGAVALLAAAVARRLHDTGRSGLWGLIPLPFLAFGIFGLAALIDRFMTDGPIMPLFAGLMLNNMVYLLSLAGLVWMLGSAGTPGSNRFGPAPAEAPMGA
jgi:uncharacterized membrane protein YhaH (DUF805 family)